MLQNSAILVDESYHQFQRIGAIVDDLDISGDVVAGQLPEDLTRWRRQWRRRYDVLRAELQAEMRRLGNTDNEITRELRGMDQRLQKVAAATDKPESVVDARMTLQALVDGRHVLTRLRGSDDVEASTIRFQNSAGESTWPRVSWASVMLAFGVAVYRVAKKKNLPVLHPKKIAFGAVAVWVAFLDLPFIGLACLGALATGLWLQRRSAISPRRG